MEELGLIACGEFTKIGEGLIGYLFGWENTVDVFSCRWVKGGCGKAITNGNYILTI
jgi:hypothetical protein